MWLRITSGIRLIVRVRVRVRVCVWVRVSCGVWVRIHKNGGKPDALFSVLNDVIVHVHANFHIFVPMAFQ